MRTHMLRSIAVTLAVGACSTAQGQYAVPQQSAAYSGNQAAYQQSARAARASGYRAPAKWSNFGTPSSPAAATIFQPAAQSQDEEPNQPLPTPAKPEELSAPRAQRSAPPQTPPPAPSATSPSAGVPAPGSAGVGHGNPYHEAMQSPWAGSGQPAEGYSTLGARPELHPWFGGANLLFLTMENNSDRRLVADGTAPVLTTSAVDADSDVGFDIYAGRYFDCGRYGVSVGYFRFNPDEESQTASSSMPRSTFPQWRDISLNPGGGADTVYNHFDGAAAYRARRDLRFQSIEANVTHFGILGAQRAAAACGNGLSGLLHRFGLPAQWCNTGSGYGGAAGPLVRPTSGRIQVATSHGFRWFEMEDEFEFAANIDGSGGYQAADAYYNVETDNNLYGYQFGSRVTYCLSNRCNLGIGGKFGIYGNDVELRQRVGTLDTTAFRTGTLTDRIRTEDSDTVLATLGELDLGLGYRLSNAWTVRGGYRLIGLSGVATTTDSFASEYSSLASAGRVNADDSVILHGGYVGLEFNW